MDYETSTRTTAERAGLPEETAERIEHATLRTPADRISGGEAQDVAAQLPARLRDDLRPPREGAGAFGVDEFVRRIPERGDIGPDDARAGAAAVLTTVRDAVRPKEFDDVLSQLPQEYLGGWSRRWRESAGVQSRADGRGEGSTRSGGAR